MKRTIRTFVMTALALVLLLNSGCNPLIGGLASLASFGLGYWTATLNPQVQTTTEYFIDGQRVDPSVINQ